MLLWYLILFFYFLIWKPLGQIYVHFDYLWLLVKGFPLGLCMIQYLLLLLQSITRFRITTLCSRKIVLCSSKNWILFISSFLQLRKCCLSISGTTPSPSKSKKKSLCTAIPKAILRWRKTPDLKSADYIPKFCLIFPIQHNFSKMCDLQASLRWEGC